MSTQAQSTEHTRELFIIAGEMSGDGYGAELVRELTKQAPHIRVSGLGGPQMAAAGVDLMQDLTSHAMMGFAGLLENIGGLLFGAFSVSKAVQDLLGVHEALVPDAGGAIAGRGQARPGRV